MRTLLACFGVCLVVAVQPANAQNRRSEHAASRHRMGAAVAQPQRTRTATPEMLIFQRAQLRARERTERIETRKRLGLSKLRPGPMRYLMWADRFHPIYPFNTLVYVQGF